MGQDRDMNETHTITGTTTSNAVTLTATDPAGTVLAKGRTNSTGYRYLVVRYSPERKFINSTHPAKVTADKRTKDITAARQAAERSPGAIILRLHTGGNYS